MNAMLNPLFSEMLNTMIQPPPIQKMYKTMYKVETVFHNSGKVYGLFATYEEALKALDYKRAVKTPPKHYFSAITEMQMVGVEVRDGEIVWSAKNRVKINYFV